MMVEVCTVATCIFTFGYLTLLVKGLYYAIDPYGSSGILNAELTRLFELASVLMISMFILLLLFWFETSGHSDILG